MLKFVTSLLYLVTPALMAVSYVNLSWDENPETSVTGYNVYWGTVSGSYTQLLDVGNAVAAAIPLPAGKRYFFAVTAYTADHLESQFSDEVSTVIPADVSVPFWYDFRVSGTLYEATEGQSGSAYWWLKSGGRLVLSNSIGMTLQGALPLSDPLRQKYALSLKIQSDNGYHPQNSFQLFLRKQLTNVVEEIYVQKRADNLTNTLNRAPWNGVSLFLRYVDDDNYYFGSIRADGYVTIRKRVSGTYTTLLQKKVLAGTYNSLNSPNLMPNSGWIGLRFSVNTDTSGLPKLGLWTDIGRTGAWTLVGEVTDNQTMFGPVITLEGMLGVRSDFMDLYMDDFRLSDPVSMTVKALIPTRETFPDSNPGVPPMIGLSHTDNNGTSLFVTGTSGHSYALERSFDLAHWQRMTTNTVPTDSSVFEWHDENTSKDGCFYRVVEVEP